MKRMNLAWGGGGTFDVLLDLRSRRLIVYSESTAVKVHETYGGENYYRSRSGMSGAGWIHGHMALRPVTTYRVNSAYVGTPKLRDIPETVPGFAVIVPIDYRDGSIPPEWPIVVRDSGFGRYGPLYMVDAYGLDALLTGKEQFFEDIEVRVQYVPDVWAEAIERIFPIRVRKGTHLAYRRALVSLFKDELAFNAFNTGEDEQAEAETNRFWKRLGLRQIGDRFFKIVQSVCWARYTREELSTVEGLQVASPQNVLVLTPTFYLQESGASRTFEAVGLFDIDGEKEEVEFEERLETAEAVKAMTGNFAEILAKFEAGARKKLERAREARRQQEQWAKEWAERDAKFRELCRQYAEIEVSVEDSIAAGNYRPDTEEFRKKYFTERESVTVKELMRFLPVCGVQRVLEHKLLPLAETV